MKVFKKEVAFEGNYIRVVKKHFRNDTGRESVWETVERTNVYDRGAVVIIPLTRERELILEKNWRVPIEKWVIQFPAGLMDVKGENEEETARRELIEETGYLAGRLVPVVPTPLSPDLTGTNAMHYFAPDVEFVGRKNGLSLDESVSEVVKVSLAKLGEFLLNLPQDVSLDLRVPGVIWVMEKQGLI